LNLNFLHFSVFRDRTGSRRPEGLRWLASVLSSERGGALERPPPLREFAKAVQGGTPRSDATDHTSSTHLCATLVCSPVVPSLNGMPARAAPREPCRARAALELGCAP